MDDGPKGHKGKPPKKPQKSLSKLGRLGNFQNKELEDAYNSFYEQTFSSRGHVTFYTFAMLGVLLAFTAFYAASDSCWRCSDKVFVGLSGLCFIAIFISFVMRFIFGGLLKYSQESERNFFFFAPYCKIQKKKKNLTKKSCLRVLLCGTCG